MNMKSKRTLAIWALAISLCATTIAYAVLSTTLRISGSVTKKGGNWDIQFTDVAWVAGEKLTTSPTASGTKLNFAVELKEPGDYVVIGFKISNKGTIDAVASPPSGGYLKVNNETVNVSNASDRGTANNVTCWISGTSSLSNNYSDVCFDMELIQAGTSTAKKYLICKYDEVNSSSTATVNVEYTNYFYQAS